MSTHAPLTSNFQPWYTHLIPHSSLRPKNSGAPRCGQYESTNPGVPFESRNAIRFSPSSFTRTGGQSAEGISSLRHAGIQNLRNRSPMGVPLPV